MSTVHTENLRWTEDLQRPVFRHVATEAMVQQGPVLDIGCGDGLMLDMLRQKNIEGEGLDLSDVAVEKCKQTGIRAAVYDFESATTPVPFPAKAFPTVILLDTLEHVEMPVELFKEALRVSSRDVIISVPNFNSLPARVQVLLGHVPENNRPGKLHVYWFNLRTLYRMFSNTHAHIVELRSNTFWEHKPVLGHAMKWLVRRWPSLFALSFVIKVGKDQT